MDDDRGSLSPTSRHQVSPHSRHHHSNRRFLFYGVSTVTSLLSFITVATATGLCHWWNLGIAAATRPGVRDKVSPFDWSPFPPPFIWWEFTDWPQCHTYLQFNRWLHKVHLISTSSTCCWHQKTAGSCNKTVQESSSFSFVLNVGHPDMQPNSTLFNAVHSGRGIWEYSAFVRYVRVFVWGVRQRSGLTIYFLLPKFVK